MTDPDDAPAWDEPTWDDAKAEYLMGATVLVGLTRPGPDGAVHEQMFGTVVAVEARGVQLHLLGHRTGETFWLPPDLSTFTPAHPGVYRLRSTGETVTDPDYTTTWSILPPDA